MSVDTESRLAEIVGGLSVALARAFKLIEPGRQNPATADWERAFRIFDLLLEHSIRRFGDEQDETCRLPVLRRG
jgi:hypothetical protein